MKTKKIEVYDRLNNRPKFQGQIFKGKSMTMPGQSVTPQEIIRAMTTGVPTPIFHEDQNISSFQRMDPLDKIDYLRDLQTRNVALSENITFQVRKLQAQQKLKEMHETRERIKAEVLQEIKDKT